jgi:hypothetical protein
MFISKKSFLYLTVYDWVDPPTQPLVMPPTSQLHCTFRAGGNMVERCGKGRDLMVRQEART